MSEQPTSESMPALPQLLPAEPESEERITYAPACLIPREVVEPTSKFKPVRGLTVEEFRDAHRHITQAALTKLGDRLPLLVEDLTPSQAVLAFGILSDKYRDMTGGMSPQVIHNTQININGIDRAAALASLTSGPPRSIAAAT